MQKHRKLKSLRLTLISSLCLGAVVSFATAAKADGSFPDISGTNVWNNTAPIFDRGGSGIDPQLVERARRLNQEADQAFKACDAAVLAAQQGGTRGPRQFLRNPQSTDAEFPVACQRLNELRQEAVSLRSQLDAAARAGGSPGFRTW
ncbi:MAG TPA: hypothetical protein DDW76_36920 [Cyanobacteria bacterium UBA11369]|nr:hypothetical protein [Cyanobacteria bacterium UBA11371]HBE54189.1 hypothetical protein [Cyanobacteria bacterium UBA11369]